MTKSENNGIVISTSAATKTTRSTSSVTIYSFAALQVNIDCNVFEHLAGQYAKRYGDRCAGRDHMDRILAQMKVAPKSTYGRVNYLQAMNNSTGHEVKEDLESALDCKDIVINFHPKYVDCIIIPPLPMASAAPICTTKPKFTRKSTTNDNNGSSVSPWPQHQRVILVDRYCGEAVLRGAHIYVRGILCADVAIQPKELVAVYVHLDGHYTRGCDISAYQQGSCAFLGVGEAMCSRSQMFSLSHGLAVRMMISPQSDDGEAYYHPPSLPSTVSEGKFILQNLPSIITSHALLYDIIHKKDTIQHSTDHKNKNIVILDMCCAPGGKTSHIASLLKRFYSDNFLIVACDKSRKKISEMKVFLQTMNATTCVVPLVMDSTALLLLPNGAASSTTDDTKAHSWPSVYEVLSTCSKALNSSNGDTNSNDIIEHINHDNVKGFYPESFDRILLDPPCSALGLRPKLKVELTIQQLQRFPKYQKRLVRNAVSLLKVGGILTYSTCTIHGEENEGICYYILHKYPFMRLLPIDKDDLKEEKQWGLPGLGLSDDERRCVKRYDPSLEDAVGFFIAKFIKLSPDIKHASHEKETNSLLNEFIVT